MKGNLIYRIKRIKLYAIFALLLLACSKDEDSNICDVVVCYNGGYCLNGACECSPGYEGLNCLDVITPTAVNIKYLRFNGFPPLKGIRSWDSNGGAEAEPYMRISQNGIWVWDSKVFAQDADPNETYLIELDTALRMVNFDEVTFSLLDFDDIGGDDLIDTHTRNLFSKERGLPKEIAVTMNNGTSLTIRMDYEF